jgi:DNA-binding MarR family transcriptional regulator
MKENEELGMFVFFPTKLLETLTPRQAVIMGMIIGMAKKSGYAYPSNKTMANILNMTTITLQRELAILEQKGVMHRELIRNERMEVVSRRIYPHINLNGEVISDLIGGVVSKSSSPSYQNCNSNSNNSNNIINKDIKEICVHGFSFDSFWSLYQKKGVKATAIRAFQKLRKDEIELIQNHIPKYIEAHRKTEKMDFIPHFSTYLNQKRWNDELPYSHSVENKGSWLDQFR